MVRTNNNDTLSAVPKNGYGLTLTLMPIQTMSAETFREEADPTPSTYDWFNVDSPVTAFTYTPLEGKKRKVTITLPADFAEYIYSQDGVAYAHNGLGSIEVVLNSSTDDTLSIGGVSSANIADPDMDDYSLINLPDLSFTTSGINYALDTSTWGREHKMVRGAYAKGYGYDIPANTVKSLPEGKKAYGGASIYDDLSTVDLVWGAERNEDGSIDCADGYSWDDTLQQCKKDEEEDTGMDADALMKYGLYGLLAVAAISLLK